jgi:hypothetical protein
MLIGGNGTWLNRECMETTPIHAGRNTNTRRSGCRCEAVSAIIAKIAIVAPWSIAVPVL